THGNAALNLGEIFADPDLDEQFLDLAQGTGRIHPLGIGRKLPHRFDIGREPGKAVRGALLAVEQPVDHLMIYRDALAHRHRCVCEQRLDGLRRRVCKRNQLSPSVGAFSLVQHGDAGGVAPTARSVARHPPKLARTAPQDYACSAQKQRRRAISGSLPRLCTAVAALLTTWNDIDRLGYPALTWESSQTARVERFDATSFQYRPRCLLAFPRRRRLGDREPHRALRADGDVSVLHLAHLARWRFRLQRSTR